LSPRNGASADKLPTYGSDHILHPSPLLIKLISLVQRLGDLLFQLVVELLYVKAGFAFKAN
jgi:hypothetical protein